MSTRSGIVRKTDTGWEGIYCHFDGYLSNNGRILNEFYSDPDKVEELIALGDISGLDETVETTEAYHRDRDEDRHSSTGATLEEVISQIDGEYFYYFDDNAWWVIMPDGKEMLLTDALEEGENEDEN
jgi:hypothetical protein